jgi:hypothetical protein
MTIKRISSRQTFFLKRVFPVLWFAMVALAPAAGLAGARAGKAVPPPVFIVPLLLLVIGYVAAHHAHPAPAGSICQE